MKKIITIITILFLAVNVSAQSNDVLKLKNGSEIRGKIIEKNDDQIRIRTKDGSIWNYSTDEIASIGNYQPKVSGPGFYMRANLGIMGGDNVSPSFHVINGYSFNSHWDAGFGLGMETFIWDGYIPLFAEGRYNLLNKTYTPFVSLMAGYDVPMRNWDSNKGGFTTNARIGFTTCVGNRVGFSTSLGYRFAYLTEVSNVWDDFVTIREINRFDIRLEITIK